MQLQERYLFDRAKSLRNESTPFEIAMWRQMSRSQLGHKFRRQHVIGNAIVDFFCPAKGLIVEIDGDTHDPAKDAARDERHTRKGYATLRFTNADVGRNIAGVIERLQAKLAKLPDRWNNGLPRPADAMRRHPSPEGEGT